MRAPVKGQIALLSESRSTILTAIWSFSGMHAVVPDQFGWDSENLAASLVAARVLLFLNSSLHRMWRRRWGYKRFCMNCRSHVCHKALLAVGSRCIRRDIGLHCRANWWRW